MADIKWIKITTDIFDDEKILLIESMPDADSIIVIWFKLLCLAGKQNNNGEFVINDNFPYTDKMLATIFRRKESTVKMALEVFEQFGMVEVIDGIITIPNWEKHQNVEQMEKIREQNRIRQRNHRAAKMISTTVDVCEYCGGVATGVDHIIPSAKGGKTIDENLVPCCQRCNTVKNDKPLVKFLNILGSDFIDKERVINSEKLSRFVFYDGEKFNEVRDSHVTTCDSHATDKNRIDKNREEENKRFIPPTLEEVREYVNEKGMSVDPVQFYNYFTEGKWKDSQGKQVKNWKQKLITWEKFNIKEAPKRTLNNFNSSETTSEDLDDWSQKNQDDFYSRWGEQE